jgi:hypothetical protein
VPWASPLTEARAIARYNCPLASIIQF